MLTDTQRIARMKNEIVSDVTSGVVPSTVTTYSELHDYVDANGYGGFFDEPVDEARVDQFNRVSGVIDAWIKSGVLRTVGLA